MNYYEESKSELASMEEMKEKLEAFLNEKTDGEVHITFEPYTSSEKKLILTLNKKQKEKNNDSNRERITRLIDEERARARKRKRRITQLTERNLWTKSANHQFAAKGFEQWFENRRLGNDLEKSIRTILGDLGRVEQKLIERNKAVIGILKKKQVRKHPSNSFKIRM